MKYLVFLDLDGVLNSVKSFKANPHDSRAFDPEAVTALNYILSETGAEIVVSSVWRLGKSTIRLQRTLQERGVRGTVIDKTSRIFHNVKKPGVPERPEGEYCPNDWGLVQAKRGEEIQAWLDDYQALYPDDEVRFVIIDDDADMVHLLPKLVQTDNEVGITMKDAEKAVRMLTEEV